MGDIFTSCQGGIFLLKEQNSFLIQSRSLGVDKVDTLLKYIASDKTNRSFTWEQSSQKDYSTFILGRLYSVKDRLRIISCDCKSCTRERCSDVSFQSRESELEEYLSSVLSGRNLLPPAASSSPCSRHRAWTGRFCSCFQASWEGEEPTVAFDLLQSWTAKQQTGHCKVVK